MFKKLAFTVATIVLVCIILPAVVFVAWLSIQEGCLLCFEGDGRGGLLEAAINLVIAALLGWGVCKLIRRFA